MSDVLGTFEQAVLLALVRLREDAYGRAILKGVQARLNRDVVAGAVYATLDRLEDKDLITSRLAPGTSIRGGKPRRYYAITKAGVRALNESKAAVESLWHGFRWPLKGSV
jgi:DNA-binding PadR family transcriptional regulator